MLRGAAGNEYVREGPVKVPTKCKAGSWNATGAPGAHARALFVFFIFLGFRRPEVMEERFSPVCRFCMSHFHYF